MRIKSLFLLLALSALMLGRPHSSLAREKRASAAADEAPSADGGRLILKLSPILPYNVGISVRIDDQTAGVVSRAQTYERDLPPGRHRIQVFPNGHGREAWEAILDFSNGRTHAFIVKFGERVILLPISLTR